MCAKRSNFDCVSEKYPNTGVSVERESSLPSNPIFRHDLVVPSTRHLENPHQNKKRRQTKPQLIEELNLKTEEIIGELSSKGKFLPCEVVKGVLLDLTQAASRQHGFRIPLKELSVFTNFSRLHGRVEELIKVYCMFTPVTTLYELSIALAQSEKVASYDELHLGPLIKHPRVKDYFKPPEDLESPPEITIHLLHSHLFRMVDKTKKKGKFTMEEYLEFVRKKQDLSSVNHLCVRLLSFPLLIQTNFKFRTTQSGLRNRMQEELMKEMDTLLTHETEQMKRKFTDLKNANDPLSIKKSLSGKDPVAILVDVYETFKNYFGQYQRLRLTDFFQWAIKDATVRHLLLLSIYKGAYSADKLMPEFFQESQPGAATPETQPYHYTVYKSERELFLEVMQRLQALPSPTDLTSLASVETCIVEKFNVSSFTDLGNGPFLTFIAEQSQLKEELGQGMVGAAPHTAGTKKKVLRIVSQLGQEHRENEDVVRRAVTEQLAITSFQELGCGKIARLIADLKREPQVAGIQGGHCVTYLSPVIINSRLKRSSAQEHGHSKAVGVLGHQSREEALKRLQDAPLLEDLGEWTHWQLVFQPQFGSLSNFLLSTEKGRSKSGTTALEVAPGKLLKIAPDSSVQDFYKAVDSFDAVGAAGHLVSLIVARGNTQDISPQLLANHVTSSLERKMAEDEDKTEGETVVSKFIFWCLLRIPIQICELTATEIFLDPLRKVTSSSTVNDLILQSVTVEQRRFFQALGMCVGNERWTEDRHAMMEEAKENRKGQEVREVAVKSKSGQLLELHHNQEDALGRVSTCAPTQSHVDGQTLEPADSTGGSEKREEHAPLSLASAEELQERETECEAIVETIRHEEFGMGVELEGEQRLVAAKQREREGRGIKRLSLELYSKDTHFVLELIQNADDNTYPQSSPALLVPSLKFVIGDKAIVVMNNEIGFSEKNIRAICDVGKSTKGAHRSGYIGQKGIGFKSVFRITNTPEIHSNGFHIRFDASSDPIGFILPHWWNPEDSETPADASWMTRIVLPLKPDLVASNMAKKFNDVQPSLLLFLHRLRSITVQDEVSESLREMVREDRGTGVVEICHTHNARRTTDRWLVVRKILDKANQFKPDVEATELALAFPLPPDLETVVLSKDLHQQQVFAFLPLRSYGFRFIIQGDFDLPSSRECVTSDSSWNQWLREEIPALFLKAMEDIKGFATSHGSLTDIEAVALFFQFVPLEGELLDFFQPLTSQILNLLRGTNCLPTDPQHVPAEADFTFDTLVTPTSNLFLESDLMWKQPSQILFVRDAFIREHISQVILERALKLSYLHTSLLPYINFSLQSQLDIRSMTIDHLKEIAEMVIQCYANQSSADFTSEPAYDEDELFEDEKVTSRDLFVQWIANWLACVHIIMEEEAGTGRPHALIVSVLKDLPILPLEDGRLVSSSTSGVFFPPDYQGSEEDDSMVKYRDLHKEMSVLDKTLLGEGDDMVQSRMRKVLELLGVKSLQPMDVIRHHILPQFKQHYTEKRPSLLCKYLQYIKESISQRGSGVTEKEVIPLLKESAVLLTNEGPQPVSQDGLTIHFSSNYACQPDVVQMFPDVKWITVSADYIASVLGNHGEVLSWVNFLEKIGVKKGIVVKRASEPITKGSSRWKELKSSSIKRFPDADITLRDWQSPEVQAIIECSPAKKSGKKKKKKQQQAQPQLQEQPGYVRQQMQKLVELLDKSWDNFYAQRLEANVYDAKNEEFLEITVPSSFSKYLVQRPWLPSTSTGDLALYKGSELFNQNSAELRKLLHMHAPFLDAKVQSVEFLKHLKVHSSITRLQLLDYLVAWSKQTPFHTSIDHMTRVYSYLLDSAEDSEMEVISEKFTEESSALVFVPERYDDVPSSNDVDGHFISVHDACWMDPTSVIYNKQKYNWSSLPETLPKILSLHYSSITMQELLGQVRLNKEPLARSYLVLLNFNSSLGARPEADHIRDFNNIVFHLVKQCEDGVITESYLQSNLRNLRVFPSHHHVWVTLKDCLLENDDSKFAKMFGKVEHVHFLQWSSKLAEGRKRDLVADQKSALLSLFKIPRLSAEVRTLVDHGRDVSSMEDLKGKISLWIPLIQKFLFHNCKEQYCHLVEGGIGEDLKRLQVLCAQELKCRYYIDYGEERHFSPEPTPKPCALEKDVSGIPIIYVSEKKKDKPPTFLLSPLTELFMNGVEDEEASSFANFLAQLLSELPENQDDVDDIAKELQLSNMPDEELLWLVPVPVKPVAIQEDTFSDIDSDDDELLENQEEPANEADSREGSKAVTSWPPRSAVEPSSSHKRQNLEPGTIVRKPENLSDDVVGEKEVREMREKHLIPPGGDTGVTHEGMETQEEKLKQGARGYVQDVGESSRSTTGHVQGGGGHHQQDGRVPFDGQHHRDHFSEEPPAGSPPVGVQQHHGSRADYSESAGDVSQDEPHGVDHAGQSYSHLGDRSDVPGTKPSQRRSPMKYPTTWQEMQSAKQEIPDEDLVDIQNFVADVSPSDKTAVIPLIEIDNSSDLESIMKIGRWGEELVTTVLLRRGMLPSGQLISSVNWVNQSGETGKPYDIEVELESSEGAEQSKVYIEVKSTSASTKDVVDFSWRELKFAEEKGSGYHLYRVYNAGRASHKLCQLENLSCYLLKGPVRLLLML